VIGVIDEVPADAQRRLDQPDRALHSA
jgi:hypothetical protein